MRVWLALGLILVSVFSYFVLAANFGVYQRYPVPHFLGAAVGLLWLGRLVATRRSVARIVALVFGVALTGLYVWYTLAYSTYAPRALRVAEGQTIAALTTVTLPDHEGKSRSLLAGKSGGGGSDAAQATLLVLYRGHW